MAAAAEVRANPTPADEELIGRIQAGDPDAFQVLYDRYFRRVYAFVHKRMSNRADIEETVQDAFVNVFSSLDSYRAEAPFAAWILGVTRYTLANRFKRKRHPTVALEEELGQVDDTVCTIRREPSPLEHYECGERIARIQAASRKLTTEQRRLFEEHHLRHRPIQEIARALRKSENAVKSNLYRARKLLLAR